MLELLFAHALHECTAHGIARCQIPPGEMAHRAVAMGVHKVSAFAAHRFRDQEVGSPRQHQCRGVKLHKFQVSNHRTCLPRHGDAIATGLGGVGGVGIEVAATAGGQHHGPGAQPAQAARMQHL